MLPHWGPSAVPAWAEPIGNFHEIAKAHGWEYWFRHDAYPEWYWNTIRIEGSPARAWHDATFGKDFEYQRFGPISDEAARRFDSESWAKLFADSGVRHVVLVAKHHDGWTLGPSATPNPFIPGWHATRDLVGEPGAAVRAHGEAIYGTCPFQRAEGATRDGRPVRFTRKGDVLYALVLGPPAKGTVEIEGLKITPSARVTQLAQDDPQSPALALRSEPAPAAEGSSAREPAAARKPKGA